MENYEIDRKAELIFELRDQCRLKLNCDYAITLKYGEYHLLTNEVFKETICEYAEMIGIEFSTIHIYS
jgi:hypothetical protein